jgi:RNA polymerase sigma-54 factor
MAFVQRLDLRQTQTLVMTPQLQQAIKLLQLNNLEVGEFVAQELQQNPLLDEADRSDQDQPMASAEIVEARVGTAASEHPASADDQAVQIEAGAIADPEREFFGDPGGLDDGDGPVSFSALAGSGDGDGEPFELADRLTRDISLREHLLAQLNTEIDDPAARIIGAALIECVEPSGYLADGEGTVATVATLLGIAAADVDSVLARLQQFDPPGVMARGLGECLAIQLRERDRYDPAMAALCANLNLLADHRFNDLCRLCGVDGPDLTDMIREIRALDPKPGDRFDPTTAQPVIPDILMKPARGGGWTLELNPDTLPRILVNRRYHADVNRTCRTAKEREYLTERLNAANWLVRSLDQRANTILKVAGEIVTQQEQFFLHGVSRLRPLVLRNIAETIAMHESTVSRVTSNKYMATPRGMFELKYFFSAALSRSDGEGSHSAESIRHRIKVMIDAESPAEILSDDTLVDRLRAEGVDIARRTVAKYREQLGIQSSVQRRRRKNFAGGAAG